MARSGAASREPSGYVLEDSRREVGIAPRRQKERVIREAAGETSHLAGTDHRSSSFSVSSSRADRGRKKGDEQADMNEKRREYDSNADRALAAMIEATAWENVARRLLAYTAHRLRSYGMTTGR
jgi:hypothetical protein